MNYNNEAKEPQTFEAWSSFAWFLLIHGFLIHLCV